MTIRGGGNPHSAMAAMPLREWTRRLGALPAEGAVLDRRCARRRWKYAVGTEECSRRGSNKRMECKGRPKWRDAPLTKKAPYKRNAKYPVARDVGKPLGGFRRHQGQNRGRHFASDQPINRFRVALVKLDFNGSSRSDRGPNGRARSGLLVVYRDLLAGKIGHQFDLWTRHHKGNQVVSVVCRHGRCRLGIAGREGFGTTRCFGIAGFLLRRGGRTCSRHMLRERRRGRDPLLYRSAAGIDGGGHGRRNRDLSRRRI